MSEITKLYENAGVEYLMYVVDTFPPVEYPQINFTAEKQIELIKWLSKRRLLNIAFSNDKKTYQLSNNKCTGSFCSDLATAIATLVQCELDFCSPEEKQQVKGILE